MSTTRSKSALRTPSRTVLSALPGRVVTFLRGAGTHAGVRAAMAMAGYSEADHDEGCELLQAVYAYGTGGANPALDIPAREAEAEITEWVQQHLRRLQVTLERRHPDQADLLAGVEPAGGAHAVLALAVVLDRVGALPDRCPVLETLERRGFGQLERARLGNLIRCAQTAATTDPDSRTRDPREPELVALYRWHAEWAATARAYIRRKDFLEALGLVDYRKRKPTDETIPNEAEE